MVKRNRHIRVDFFQLVDDELDFFGFGHGYMNNEIVAGILSALPWLADVIKHFAEDGFGGLDADLIRRDAIRMQPSEAVAIVVNSANALDGDAVLRMIDHDIVTNAPALPRMAPDDDKVSGQKIRGHTMPPDFIAA